MKPALATMFFGPLAEAPPTSTIDLLNAT